MSESRARTVAKAVAWKVIGLTVLSGIVWTGTRDWETTGSVALAYNGLMLLLYVAHERLWMRVSWGRSLPQGAVIWFTGLPCAGKSTLAQALARRLESPRQAVKVLDGDVIRDGLCADLGFDPDDRSENLRRVREAAKLLASTGTLVIVANITPFEADRRQIKEEIPRCLLVWVATPARVCEERDVKGMWAKARAGEIERFTGVSDPFEKPGCHDLTVHTSGTSPEPVVGRVLEALRIRQLI